MKRASAKKRWAAKYPDLGTAPQPVEPCVSPEYFELERERIFMKPATSPGEKISQEFSKIIARDLARGDLSTLENVQAGLASGALTHMPLCDQEVLLRHHYKIIDEFVSTNGS